MIYGFIIVGFIVDEKMRIKLGQISYKLSVSLKNLY